MICGAACPNSFTVDTQGQVTHSLVLLGRSILGGRLKLCVCVCFRLPLLSSVQESVLTLRYGVTSTSSSGPRLRTSRQVPRTDSSRPHLQIRGRGAASRLRLALRTPAPGTNFLRVRGCLSEEFCAEFCIGLEEAARQQQ